VPTLFRPIARTPTGRSHRAVRTPADPRALIDDVRRAVAKVAPSQPLFDIMPMPQMLSEMTIGLEYIAAAAVFRTRPDRGRHHGHAVRVGHAKVKLIGTPPKGRDRS